VPWLSLPPGAPSPAQLVMTEAGERMPGDDAKLTGPSMISSATRAAREQVGSGLSLGEAHILLRERLRHSRADFSGPRIREEARRIRATAEARERTGPIAHAACHRCPRQRQRPAP